MWEEKLICDILFPNIVFLLIDYVNLIVLAATKTDEEIFSTYLTSYIRFDSLTH
jgi:hypothetical protein